MKNILISSLAVVALSSSVYAGKNVAPAPVEPVPVPVVPTQGESFKLVGLQVGTLGFGANFAMAVNESLQLRLNVNGLKISKTKTKDDIKYDGDLKLFTAGLLADYFPFNTSTFHLSLGAYYNKNEVTATAQPKAGNYTINGNSYGADELGKLEAKLDFKKFAPYVGLGWGGKLNNSGWSWNFDIGVMYHGTPKATLTPIKGSALAHNGDAAHDTAADTTWNNIKTDVSSEESTINSDIKKYKFYPVISVGFIYRF